MAGVAVIIPAAGSGQRFGGDLPKQFQLLGGKAILQHVIERFLADGSAKKIVVAVAEPIHRTADDRVQYVIGGATRQQSVVAALRAIDDAEIVAVHDAVRPFFTIETFHKLLDAAREAGAAVPVIPVADTIHVVENDAVASTLDRAKLFAAQTPQCFRSEILRDVLARAEREGAEGTDEAGLAARYGYAVRAVPGDTMNFKITRPEDLLIAEALLERWSRK
ncbi:MAG TPA: 2-C-methyl-D-erythritol 4-phosphate cytidylyltransferase [Thermoanaerobaculia bacterium]|nr:2-C-methyl-D-erythritol 4-phosphate cytidylyltransferase [Thermoanaerobaculia bacterium]